MRGRRRHGAWFLLCCAALAGGLGGATLLLPRPVEAQQGPAPEYQVKAAFLFNFAQFVEWPAAAFPEPDSPMVIGVLGEDPFGGDLEAIVRGEVVNGHPLTVERFGRVEEITACHILFVSKGEAARLDRILAALKGRSILTVGDMSDFAGRGGMIRFVTDRSRIRLRINLEAARADELTISSKLLRPADIVSTGKE